jgi:hypothetical protein
MNHSPTPRFASWRRRGAALALAGAAVIAAAAPAGAEGSLASKAGGNDARTSTSTTVTGATAPTTATTATPPTTVAMTAPPTTAPLVVTAPNQGDLQALANGGALVAPGISQGASLQTQFRTLSAALISVYAAASGIDVNAYLAANGPAISAALGTPAPATVTALDDTFSERLGTGAGDLNKMLASLSAGANTADGAMTTAAVSLASRLAQVPLDAGASPMASLTGAGSDGLMFGMFANRSMANFAGNFPDLFSQVASTGLGTPGGVAAWNASRAAAASSLTADMSGSMLNPCGVSLLGAMASGTVSGVGSQVPGCSPCVTAGAYMHSAMNRLTSPDAYATLQIPNGNLTSQEWGSLSDWQRNSILAANPGLSNTLAAANSPQLQQQFSSASSACSTAKAGTTNYLSSNLGSMFSRLTP